MKVATGVEMITLEAEAFGGKIAIHPSRSRKRRWIWTLRLSPLKSCRA
ncbi:hypothetical protein [Brevibacillus sp. NRS-1366]